MVKKNISKESNNDLMKLEKRLNQLLSKTKNNISSEQKRKIEDTVLNKNYRFVEIINQKVNQNTVTSKNIDQEKIQACHVLSKALINLDSKQKEEIKVQIKPDIIEIKIDLIEKLSNIIYTYRKQVDSSKNEKLVDIDAEWSQIRNEAERILRRTHLLKPADNKQLQQSLWWMAEQGEESELALIQKLQVQLPYSVVDQQVLSLLNRTEEKIRTRISGNIQFLYRVLCSRDDLNPFLGKILIVENHSNSIDISTSEEIVTDIKQFFRVEQLIQGVSMPISNQVIEFNTPINRILKQRVEETGAKILQPLGRLKIVVSVPNDDMLTQLKNFEDVVQITPYTPKLNVKSQFLRHLGQPATKEAIAAARLNAARNSQSSEKSNIALPGIFIANFFTSEDRDRAAENLDHQGIHIANKPGRTKLILDLTSDSNAIESIKKIAAQIGLQSLGEKSIPKLYNSEACKVIAKGVIPSNPSPTLGLTGKGEIIAIADTGLDTGESGTLHLDFQERIDWIDSYPIQPSLSPYVLNPGDNDGASDIYSGHGTHVAGSALGNGKQAKELGLTPIPRGMAAEAKLVFQAIEQTPKWNLDGQLYWWTYYQKNPPNSGLFGIPDDLEELFEDAYNKKARIHSNSWGGGDPGVYDERSQSLDRFVWDRKDFLVLVAAGNDGKQSSSATRAIDQGSVTSPGTAKNCLTVGASENNRSDQFSDTYGYQNPKKFPYEPFQSDGIVDSINDIAAFSSRGPCEDGRCKPDVIAPGTFILSTRSSQIPSNNFAWGVYPPAQDYYMYMGGTSMATPLVAGCAALVRQYLREIHQPSIDNPSAALVKAILIHSAQYIKYRFAHPSSKPWADNEQGWGRVNLQEVLNPSEPTKVIFIDELNGLVEQERHEHKIKITDNSVPLRATLVYTDYPGEYLINNLNLVLRSPSGKDYLGNDFDEIGNADTVNNVEGIVIKSPELGQWTLEIVAEVIGSGLVDTDEQDYALVISGGGLTAI